MSVGAISRTVRPSGDAALDECQSDVRMASRDQQQLDWSSRSIVSAGVSPAGVLLSMPCSCSCKSSKRELGYAALLAGTVLCWGSVCERLD